MILETLKTAGVQQAPWETKEKKFAARIVNHLYEETDSPLRYRINRLGGRSRQEKWILQSELFNEIHKVVQTQSKFFEKHFHSRADRANWALLKFSNLQRLPAPDRLSVTGKYWIRLI